MKMLSWTAAAILCCGLIASPAEAQRAPRQDRNRIRFEEIQASQASNVYQLIQARRGMWLMRSRTATDMGNSGSGMLVFMDGAQLGGVEDLREIPLASVRVVEFLNPSETERHLGKYTTIGAIRVLSHDDTPAAPADSARAAPPR